LHPSSFTAENDPTASLAKVVHLKNAIYQQECSTKGWAFAPLVALTTGQWSSNAASLIRRLATWGVAQYGGEATAVATNMFARLGLSLQNSCGHQLVRAFTAEDPATSAAGSDYPIYLH
jgi:hypothetical protein